MIRSASATAVTSAAPASNPDSSTRGHKEVRLSRKIIYCAACKRDKPKRGGWSFACEPRAHAREFMGG